MTHETLCENTRLLKQVNELCCAREATLLFLTDFGSALYGTHLPGKSDRDLRGIFLPSLRSLAVGSAAHGIHYTTKQGSAENQRNAATDVDIDLCSLQKWLLELLPAGDIGALDLIFAPSNPACTRYRHAVLDPIFAQPLGLIGTQNRAYVAYCQKQAKKYGLRGTRAGALKCVAQWLEKLPPATKQIQASLNLAEVLTPLLSACGDGRYCTLTQVHQAPALQLCGKIYMAQISLADFANHIATVIQREERISAAARNEQVDFKALSHALRALYQMEELLCTGSIHFPLKDRLELMAIKQGEKTWPELETQILDHLALVDALLQKAPYTPVDTRFAQNCIWQAYNEVATPKPLELWGDSAPLA